LPNIATLIASRTVHRQEAGAGGLRPADAGAAWATSHRDYIRRSRQRGWMSRQS